MINLPTRSIDLERLGACPRTPKPIAPRQIGGGENYEKRNTTRQTTRASLGAVISTLIIAAVICVYTSDVTGQVLVKPKVYKHPAVIRLPDLAIMDLNEDLEPNSVYVIVGNVGSANAGPFTSGSGSERRVRRQRNTSRSGLTG